MFNHLHGGSGFVVHRFIFFIIFAVSILRIRYLALPHFAIIVSSVTFSFLAPSRVYVPLCHSLLCLQLNHPLHPSIHL